MTQIACLLIGVVALAQLQQNPDKIFDLFLSLPLGSVAFAVSVENMAPWWDRRVLTVLIGIGTTVIALTVDIAQYQNFLYLIGAVFIPLSGALVAGWWRTKGIG